MMSCSSVYNSSNDFVCQYRCQIAACMPLKSDCVFLGGQRTSSFFFFWWWWRKLMQFKIRDSFKNFFDWFARALLFQFSNIQDFNNNGRKKRHEQNKQKNDPMACDWRWFWQALSICRILLQKKSMCFFHMLKSKVVQQQFNVKPWNLQANFWLVWVANDWGTYFWKDVAIFGGGA